MAIKKVTNNNRCLVPSKFLDWNKKYAEKKSVPEIKRCIKKEIDPEGLKKLKLVFSYKMF